MVALWFHYDCQEEIMATITIKNIPDDLHVALKKRASLQRRSLNSEIIACLEASLRSLPVDLESFLYKTQVLREQVSGRLSNRDLKPLKDEGRP
jgi:plasmid stability protein